MKEEIEQLSEWADRQKWAELHERISWLNIHNPANQEIFEAACNKGLI